MATRAPLKPGSPSQVQTGPRRRTQGARPSQSTARPTPQHTGSPLGDPCTQQSSLGRYTGAYSRATLQMRSPIYRASNYAWLGIWPVCTTVSCPESRMKGAASSGHAWTRRTVGTCGPAAAGGHLSWPPPARQPPVRSPGPRGACSRAGSPPAACLCIDPLITRSIMPEQDSWKPAGKGRLLRTV